MVNKLNIDELRKKREKLKENTDIILDNIDTIATESYRVADVAHNSREILEDLDIEFKNKTGLQGSDISFLFLAVSLQLVRITILNELTKIENAGKGNRNENVLHGFQKDVLGKFDTERDVNERPYYASLEHIITTEGVPYDATSSLTDDFIQKLINKNKTWDIDIDALKVDKKLDLFKGYNGRKGANHRFSTLGHDPILGLIFGTANIMTDTITCVRAPMFESGIGIPILTTNHVVYTSDFKEPSIGTYGSTIIMLQKMMERSFKQPTALVAALIKQIIHIGTDLYTPMGIQIPGANLVLGKADVERLTKYINAGDIIKVGVSAKLSEFINMVIAVLHTLMYKSLTDDSNEIYSIRTRKIIKYSNLIATGSNVLYVAGNMALGNENAIRKLDIGGLIILLKRIREDEEFINSIKKEFVLGNFNNMIRGEELKLIEADLWD